MSKTLILIQLQRLESETRSVAAKLLNSATDFQLVQLLKQAELEHGYRAKQMQRELDCCSGQGTWKEQMFSEHSGVGESCEVLRFTDPLETAVAAERKLHDLYEMARELVRSRVVNEAAAEQTALNNKFLEMKTQKTLKMTCLPATDACA